MTKRNRYLLKDQPQVKVIAQADTQTAHRIRLTLLAAVFAGIFYFFGNNLWYALTGG